MRDTQRVYDAPLIERTIDREVGCLTIPARTNYVVVETTEEMTRVHYQRISNGQVVDGFGSEKFGSDLQEAIIRHLIKLNPGYCGDDLS